MPEPRWTIGNALDEAPSTQMPNSVVVTDIRMPIGSMVVFMLKWSIAAIPAVLILSATIGGIWLLLAACYSAIRP